MTTVPQVIFAGTPAFALASLRALVNSGVVPVAVLTQPDRPAGRGKKRVPGPVKAFAVEQGIDVLQPASLKDEESVAALAAYAPRLIIVAAYGLLLPESVLELPAHGCLNVHASLLPRWRGAAPIQSAILAGDERTGISLMKMTAGLDSGPVFAEAAIGIGERETAGELHDRLAHLGGDLLVRELPAILGGKLAEEQDESAATYAGKIAPADAELAWDRPATELERQVRAFNPVPGAWFMALGERIKCWQADVQPASGTSVPPGTVYMRDDALLVACGDGALRLLSLQRPGKRCVSAREFCNQLELAGQVLPGGQPAG